MSARALVGLALALMMLAPAAAAAAPTEPDYPSDLVALLPGWIETSERLVTEQDRAKPWWGDAEAFLTRAKGAQAEGRVRVAMFHLETFEELLLGNRLIDDGKALGSDAEAKSFVLQRTSGWNEDAERAWTAYRAKLHGYDGQLHSLVTLEKALYSSDIALTGILNEDNFDYLSRELPKQDGFPENYVFGLVRATNTPILNLRFATDILDAAVKEEGIPPRVDDARWANITATALAYGQTDEKAPAFLEGLDARGKPVRAGGEAILSVAFILAEQRATRANSMETIFGDARSRGLDVVRDAAKGMNKQFNNTTLEAPRGHGLSGVFTSDAIDRVLLTREYMSRDQAELGTVIVAWAQLEHQGYATNTLASVSPVEPPPTPSPTKPAPLPGALAMLGIVAVVAAFARSARRPR
ncbi:MAG TPA: hypothetical protein VM370_08640 [Candidatus Thermoplasmatota archaeon]|nr:hypothetical protein [Candidatus Thermoplasmatota archaeon]